MDNRQKLAIHTGLVTGKRKIAAHSFHLKIQSDDFAQMQYVPGFTVDVFLGNPLVDPGCEDRKYSFWNYEPVYQTADFVICTFSNGKGAEWVKKIKTGDPVFFRPPKGKLLADNSADNYLLIGDVTSLSHLYEINRNLAISKNIFSFIYAERQADIFPDMDGSFPFHHHIISTGQPDDIISAIIHHLPEKTDNTIAYILGHPDVCISLHRYLNQDRQFPLQQLKTKPFWKNAGRQNQVQEG